MTRKVKKWITSLEHESGVDFNQKAGITLTLTMHLGEDCSIPLCRWLLLIYASSFVLFGEVEALSWNLQACTVLKEQNYYS